MSKRRKKKKTLKNNLKYELYGILILLFSVIALSREGSVAQSLTYLFRFFFGVWDWIVPIVFILIGLYVMIQRKWPKTWSARRTGWSLIIFGLVIMSHIHLFTQRYPQGGLKPGLIINETWQKMTSAITNQGILLEPDVGGGMVGALLYALLFLLFNQLGAKLVQYTLFFIGFLLVTGLSIVELIQLIKRSVKVVFFKTNTGIREFVRLLRSDEEKSGVLNRKQRDSDGTKVSISSKMKQFVMNTKNKLQKKKKDSDQSDVEKDVQVIHLNEFEQSPVIRDFMDLVNEKVENQDQIEHHLPVNDDRLEPLNEEPSEQVFESMEQENNDSEQEGTPPLEVSASGTVRVPIDHHAQKKGSQNDKEAISDEELEVDLEIEPKKLEKPYVLPSFHLLSRPESHGKNSQSGDYRANAKKLETTLESFGVKTRVLEVVRGPAVTRYELQPDIGVKVSSIVRLTDDIALALAAKDIRMEAPIPGKSAIGIEVPNGEISVVTMREVMESTAFKESESKLSIVLGRDISGQPIVANLARMPHLLVAGATGSGKSVCINGIITSILYKAKPDEVKFLMIDPKMVELNVYNGIPHLLAPVVTDPRRASLALKKIVVEMEKRYELFSKSGTRNIEGYNELQRTNELDPLPYIVVVIDELADLMMVAANDVEDAICRLAQMARAAGIHLIIATQRPSVDVITGLIKANVPSRIAFGVSSQVDSRTILDSVGAEKLLGRGDMLFLPVGASKPLRVQGAFLSDHEVEAIVEHCREHGEAEYREELVPEVNEDDDSFADDEADELYEQAVQIVIEAKQASVSLLQRRLRVGYTRAARMIDYMESKGVIGPYEGSKPREVLITLEQHSQNTQNTASS